MATSFIVKFEGAYYTRRDSDGRARASKYVGYATRMPFGVAGEVAQHLRDLDYIDAIVCLPDGQPATQADVRVELSDLVQIQKFNEVWGSDPEPSTVADNQS